METFLEEESKMTFISESRIEDFHFSTDCPSLTFLGLIFFVCEMNWDKIGFKILS